VQPGDGPAASALHEERVVARDDRLPGIRPRPSLGRRLDIMARHSFPTTSTLLAMLACCLPFGFADQAVLLPAVTLGCVYFWSLFRPASLPAPVVFLLGLVLDLLGYLPLGVGVLALLTVHGLTLRWRRRLSQQGFMLVWLVMACLGLGSALLTWLLTSVLSLALMPLDPALFEATLAAALYPALAILLTGAHRSIANPDRV
jgi:rod shape-determining protein MreD